MSAGFTFWAVRSRDGKWYRRKGYGGSGDSWVESVEKGGRIFTKLGGARTVARWWGRHHPEYGVPEIVEFAATETRIIDETEELKKADAREQKRQQNRAVNAAKRRLTEAHETLDRLLGRLKPHED